MGSDIAYHGSFCADEPITGAHSVSNSVGDFNSIYVNIRLDCTAAIADQTHQRVRQSRSSPARYRHASELQCSCHYFDHVSRPRALGTQAGMEDPRSKQTMNLRRSESGREPVAAGAQNFMTKMEATANA